MNHPFTEEEMMKSAISTLLLAAAVRAAPAVSADNKTPQPYATSNLLNLLPRTVEIKEKRKGWLYGYFPFGVAPYPTGPLADPYLEKEIAGWRRPVFELGAIIVKETGEAVQGVIAVSRDIIPVAIAQNPAI